jgi:opacity protein-like surface antigen
MFQANTLKTLQDDPICNNLASCVAATDFCFRLSISDSRGVQVWKRKLCVGLLNIMDPWGAVSLRFGKMTQFWFRLLIAPLLVSSLHAQDRAGGNEYGILFGGQFANAQWVGTTTNSRMYEVEGQYRRILYKSRRFALRYVAEFVPLSLVGDPQLNGQRVYAYGIGGSPTGIQVNWVRYHRIQPFLASGGGFLFFNRQLFGATQLNFTVQVGIGMELFRSDRHSLGIGYQYHHISNANLGRDNPGMDSHVVFVGVTFRRKRQVPSSKLLAGRRAFLSLQQAH